MAEKKAPDLTLSAGRDSGWWVKEIKKSVKDWTKSRDRGEKVLKRYRDEREQAEENQKQFNIFYSNVETLKPAIYSQSPVPDIRRRWQDKKDALGRVAATVLQRSTAYCIESYDFHSVLKRVRDDYLIPGFAVARVLYKPYTKGQGAEEEIVWHEARADYIPWDRFAMSRAKVYERVWWAATGDDLDRGEVETQFGKEVADRITYGFKDSSDDESESPEGKVRVWEVWCKRARSRFFVAEGFDGWVRPPESDPLRLENFYPWPKPLWSVTTNDTLRPSPEYFQYQDQAIELDDLTERIDVLTSALRRRGIYDGSYKELFEVLTGMNDNQFVGVEDWATIMAKGGLEKVAMEMPIDGIVGAIVQLEDRREKVKQIIYEITGISDIVRGASNANETATAQQIKGRWAGLRISSRQSDFAVFARDLIRLKAEVIAERFDPQTLALMSGVQLPYQQQKQQWMAMQQANAARPPMPGQPPPQQPNPEEVRFYAQPTWEEVMKVLKSDKLRGFKIDIETDSTVQPDADTEKQARTELLGAIGQAAQSLGAGVQSGVISQEFAKEAFAFAMRAFKAGSALEEALDNMEANPGASPQQLQQQQQQLQQQQAEVQKQGQQVAQREQQAKEAEHRAALREKDLKNDSDKLAAERKLFDLERQMRGEMEQVAQKHAGEIEELGGNAENVIRQIIATLPMQSQPGADSPAEERAERKGKSPSPAIRDIHIHTGGDAVETIDKTPKPKKPRKLRLMDQDDGSLLAEEILDPETQEQL